MLDFIWCDYAELALVLLFPYNDPDSIHIGLTASNRTDEILRPHVKPHINYHALADRTVFMQNEGTIHTAMISHEFHDQCDKWCPPVASKGSRYQYGWQGMGGFIKPYQWYQTITATRSWSSCSVHNEWQNITYWALLNCWLDYWSYHLFTRNVYSAWCIISMRWSMFKKLYSEIIFEQ